MTLLMHPPGVVPRSGTYALHPDHCAVELSARHLLARTVRGRIAPFDGGLHIDGEDPGASSVWMDLDATSLSTGSPRYDAALKGPDLLDVARFPLVHFESTSVTREGPDRFGVEGDLYVRDLVADVSLDVRVLPSPPERVTLTASAVIRRSTFGLVAPERAERLGLLVGDIVKVRLGVEFGR